ncbi:MAG: DUF885 domain-containing protein [Acidobacteriota bacterium]
MKLTRRSVCLTAAGAAAHSVLSQRARGQTKAAKSIEDFFREFTDEWVRNNPGLATSTHYFTGEEQDRLERELAPITLAEARKRINLARKGLAELRGFDRSRLSETQRLSADVMEWQLNIVVQEEPFLDYSFPLEQMNGFNVGAVERFTVSRAITKLRDAENYVAALGQVGARMEEANAEAKRLQAKGTIPPKFILQATIKQMQSFVDPSPGQSPFVTAFADKMAAVAAIPTAKREELRAAAEKIVATQIYPSWKKATATLQTQLPRSTDDAGLWRLKGGAEAYAFFLKRYTTTELSAEQIHEIGLRQVATLEAQMDTLFRKLGRTDGSVKDRTEKLRLDLQYPNPTSEASRAQIMKDLDAIVRDAEKRAALLFDKRPKAPVVVQPFPAFREANAAANYNAPPPDGSRPGTVQYPRRIERMTKFGLRTLAYHEAVPGHHFHIALQVENPELPRFMQIRALGGLSAITEGWGLYAERLAAESGWYDGDVEGLLGQLSDELWRARRLVVDTGLHAKHWTRQQGIDYGIEASEVERYTVYPGQACSYMIGQLKILELRDKAQKALGPKFSLREYHNVVLNTGSVPLNLLERQVDAYIARTKG